MPRNTPRNVPRNSARRVSHKRPRRKPLGWKPRVAIAASIAVLALLSWSVIARSLAPASNTALTRFDAIIVLGTPADSDGNPKPNQLARVTEAVHEYDRGVAPRLILTGGAAHNRFVEAQVMARSAEAQGIPASAIVLEPQAMDTIENACYSTRMMKARGWRSAEVIGAPYQLPRAGLILNALAQDAAAPNSMPLQWTTHAAPPLSPQSAAYQNALSAVEVLKTARYLIWARWTEHCEP
ncbi:MAG TPA: YdcF family protein [Terracidiphilus sp.]